MLERYGRRTRLLIEIKVRERDRTAGTHRALASAVARALRDGGVEREAWVLSFDDEALRIVANEARGAAVELNLRRARRMGPALRSQLGKLFALSVDVRGLSPGLVRATQQAGRPVIVFTCNTRQALGAALKAGVDAIMSDKPGWARENVERRLARSGRSR